MKPLSLRILRLFGEMGEDQLDLHVLFEAGGNEPEERLRVLMPSMSWCGQVCWTRAVATSTR